MLSEEQIKEIKDDLEFSENWWNGATEHEPIAQDEIDLCKDMNAHVRLLMGELDTLQQQNKQLIEVIDRASFLLRHDAPAYRMMQDAIKGQIQGNGEER